MNKKILIIGIIILFLGTLITPSVAVNAKKYEHLNNKCSNDDIDWWLKFHHDDENTGYTTSSAPVTNKVLWKYETGFYIISSPSIFEGKVYFGSEDEKFYCLDAYSGEKYWSKSIPGGTSISSPTIYNDSVIQCTTYYKVFCWEAFDGDLIWEYSKDYGSCDSPTVVNDKVYITKSRGDSGNNASFFCLNAETGVEIWNYPMGWWELSSPVYYDEMVYIGSENLSLYCFDANTGEVLWVAPSYGGLGSPMISNGKIYSGFNGVHCLNADNGTNIWSYYNTSTYSTPALAYGKIYFLGRDPGGVYCLDAGTGELEWYYYTNDLENGFSSPAVADGKVFVGLWSSGKLICLDAFNGEFVWDYKVSISEWMSSSPGIADNILYIGGCLNKLYAFGGFEPPPDAPNQPDGEINGIIDIKYSYCSNTTDPEDDKVQYRFDWDSEGSHNYSNWSVFVPSGESIIMDHSWDNPGEYIVKVQARDEHYALSNWSDGLTVIISENNPPEAPEIEGPTRGVKGVFYNFTFKSSDPEDDEIYYFIKWGDGSDEIWDGPYDSGEEILFSHSFPFKNTFKIEAKAKDPYDTESDWSEHEITIPRTRSNSYLWYQWLIQRYPVIERLLSFVR
jgi:outer membrane protein assembly factor BamB